MLTFDSFEDRSEDYEKQSFFRSDVSFGTPTYKNRFVNGDMAIDTINFGSAVPLMSASNLAAASNLIAYSNVYAGDGPVPDASQAVKALQVYNTLPRTGVADLQQVANQWGAGNMWAGGHYEAQVVDVAEESSVNQLPEGIRKAHRFSIKEHNAAGKRGHGVLLAQSVDRQNVSDILSTWGYPNGVATPITVSFYFYTTVASYEDPETFYLSVQNTNRTMSYVRPFDVKDRRFWQAIKLTIPAPTIDKAAEWEAWKSSGLHVSILNGCFARTTLTPNTWVFGDALTVPTDSGRFVLGQAGDHVMVTACQLESGAAATAFERRAPEVERRFVDFYSASGKTAVVDSSLGQGNVVCAGSLSAANMGLRNLVVNGDFGVDPHDTRTYPLVVAASSPCQSYDFNTFATIASNGRTEGLWSTEVGERSSLVLKVGKTGVNKLKGITSALKIAVVNQADNPMTGGHSLLTHMMQPCVLAGLGWGTSSPSSVTVSFWIFSTVSTNFVLSLRTLVPVSFATPASFVTDFPVPASAWTKITKTIPGQTMQTLASGMALGLTTGSGGAPRARIAPSKDTWVSGSFDTLASDIGREFVGVKGNFVLVSAVQFECGTIATPFETGCGAKFQQGPIATVTTTPVHMSRGLVDTPLIMIQYTLSLSNIVVPMPTGVVRRAGFTAITFPSTMTDMNLNFPVKMNPTRSSFFVPVSGLYSITFTLQCNSITGSCEARIMKFGDISATNFVASILSSGFAHTGFQTITTTAMIASPMDSIAFGVFMQSIASSVDIGASNSMTMTLLQRFS